MTSQQLLSYKERLDNLFAVYSPEKRPLVDGLLVKYKGSEEEVIQGLVRKYGPEPLGRMHMQERRWGSRGIDRLGRRASSPLRASSTVSSLSEASAADARGDYHSRLLRFYAVYAPHKVKKVNLILQKHRGREEELFFHLVKRHGPEPPVDDDERRYASDSDTETNRSVATGSTTTTAADAVSYDADDYKWRLARFFMTYAPEKAVVVDSMLTKYRGQEDEMMRALVQRLGPEPPSPSSLTYKKRVEALLSLYVPQKADGAAELLRSHRGREQVLLATMVQKLGPEPPARALPATEPRVATYHERLARFYNMYAKERIPEVANVLRRYKGREEEMFTILVRKYGPEPEPDVDPNAPIPPEKNFAARFTRLFYKYSPDRLELIPSMLQKYRGREEEILNALVQKLGPEPPLDAPVPTKHEQQRAAASMMDGNGQLDEALRAARSAKFDMPEKRHTSGDSRGRGMDDDDLFANLLPLSAYREYIVKKIGEHSVRALERAFGIPLVNEHGDIVDDDSERSEAPTESEATRKVKRTVIVKKRRLKPAPADSNSAVGISEVTDSPLGAQSKETHHESSAPAEAPGGEYEEYDEEVEEEVDEPLPVKSSTAVPPAATREAAGKQDAVAANSSANFACLLLMLEYVELPLPVNYRVGEALRNYPLCTVVGQRDRVALQAATAIVKLMSAFDTQYKLLLREEDALRQRILRIAHKEREDVAGPVMNAVEYTWTVLRRAIELLPLYEEEQRKDLESVERVEWKGKTTWFLEKHVELTPGSAERRDESLRVASDRKMRRWKQLVGSQQASLIAGRWPGGRRGAGRAAPAEASPSLSTICRDPSTLGLSPISAGGRDMWSPEAQGGRVSYLRPPSPRGQAPQSGGSECGARHGTRASSSAVWYDNPGDHEVQGVADDLFAPFATSAMPSKELQSLQKNLRFFSEYLRDLELRATTRRGKQQRGGGGPSKASLMGTSGKPMQRRCVVASTDSLGNVSRLVKSPCAGRAARSNSSITPPCATLSTGHVPPRGGAVPSDGADPKRSRLSRVSPDSLSLERTGSSESTGRPPQERRVPNSQPLSLWMHPATETSALQAMERQHGEASSGGKDLRRPHVVCDTLSAEENRTPVVVPISRRLPSPDTAFAVPYAVGQPRLPARGKDHWGPSTPGRHSPLTVSVAQSRREAFILGETHLVQSPRSRGQATVSPPQRVMWDGHRTPGSSSLYQGEIKRKGLFGPKRDKVMANPFFFGADRR